MARSRVLIPVAVFTLGVLLHVVPALRLGFFWDDVNIFLQPFYALGSRPLRFVFSDTWAMLTTERPASYLFSCLSRASFLLGVPALHALTAAAVAFDGALLAVAARRLLDRADFSLFAGALFLTVPLSPLQAIWPATIHYAGGVALALAAMIVATRPPSSGRGLLFPSALHAAALLTLETTPALAVALVASALLGDRLGLASLEPAASRRSRACLLLFLGQLPFYVLWRLAILPRYGRPQYAAAFPALHEMVDRTVSGLSLAVWPWPLAASEAQSLPIASTVLPALLALALGLAGVALVKEASASTPRGALRSVSPIVMGVVVLLAAAIPLAVVPGGLTRVVGVTSRFNFTALPGVALVYAGLAAAATGRLARRGNALLASSLVALLVFEGAYFQLRVKAAFGEYSQQLGRLYRQLPTQVPSLADDTFLVLEDSQHESVGESGRWGMSHPEMSGYLMALYDNWSLQGCNLSQLRLAENGVRPLDWGKVSRWFAPGKRGLVLKDGLFPLPAVTWDRLVLLRFDGVNLTVVPELAIFGPSRRRIVFRNNPERIRAVPAVPSRAWCHVMPETCAGERGRWGSHTP